MNGERSTVYNEAGERYKGSWKGSKRHGKGVFFYKSGNRYEGEWKDDRRHGLGTLYILEHEESKLQVSYSGNWVNDKPSGMGVFYNEKGECYNGEWKHGKPTQEEADVRPARRRIWGDIVRGGLAGRQEMRQGNPEQGERRRL